MKTFTCIGPQQLFGENPMSSNMNINNFMAGPNGLYGDTLYVSYTVYSYATLYFLKAALSMYLLCNL